MKHCFCESHYWQRLCMIDSLNYSLPKLTEPKLKETFQISFLKYWETNGYHVSRRRFIEWPHHRISSTVSKVTSTLHALRLHHSRLWVDSGIERVKMNLILSNILSNVVKSRPWRYLIRWTEEIFESVDICHEPLGHLYRRPCRTSAGSWEN